MEKQQNVIFRSAPGGYNKRDVNAFIATLNTNFTAAEEKYQKEIASLKNELAKAAEKAGALADKEREIAVLRAQLEERATAPSSSESTLLPPDTSLDKDELEQLRKKAALYDRMSLQLGDMLIAANHNADQVLDNAHREAGQTLSAAKNTIAQSAALLSSQLDELYHSASAHAVGEISTMMRQTSRSLTAFLDELSKRRTQLEESLKQTDADTRRAAEEQIAQMLSRAEEAVNSVGAKQKKAESESEK